MNNRPLPPHDSPLVTRERVYQRTREVAALAGRTPLLIRQADYEQAKREVTGEADNDRQLALLDQLTGIAPFIPRGKS